jgi:hypothetical protein
MVQHDRYVRKVLKRMINDGLGLEEVGVKVEPRSGSGEFDVVGVGENSVVCCEVKCNGAGNSRKQLSRFRHLFPNVPVRLLQYIGSSDHLEEISLSY